MKVKFYQKNNKSPVQEYILKCQKPVREKIIRQIRYLQEYGLRPEVLDLKKLRGYPLWEIRIIGKDNIRLLCCQNTNTVHMLHIFAKKTMKTSLKDLNLGLSRYKKIFDNWYLKRYSAIIMKHTQVKQQDDLDRLIENQLKDPEFRNLWEEGEADYQLGRQIIQARIDKKISQRELAKRANTTQAVISRIESQDVSTTLQMATRIARALGKSLQISFV